MSHNPLISDFTLLTQDRDKCDRYYLLSWQGQYLIQQICTGYGKIEHQGVSYLSIYHRDTTPKVLAHNPEDQFEVSFRRKQGDKDGYALIRKRI